AIGLNAEDTAHLNFNINRNETIYGSGGPTINIFGINNAVIQGRIDNNPDIRGGGDLGSFNPVIFIHPEDASTGVVEIIANTITQAGADPGISAVARGATLGPSSSTLDITIKNNNITLTDTNSAGNFAIDTRAGSIPGDLNQTFVDLHDNT